MTEKEKNNMSSGKKTVLVIVAIGLLVVGYYGLTIYHTYLSPNVAGNEKYLYIKTGSQIGDLFANIEKKNLLKDVESFKKAAAKMKLESNIKP